MVHKRQVNDSSDAILLPVSSRIVTDSPLRVLERIEIVNPPEAALFYGSLNPIGVYERIVKA